MDSAGNVYVVGGPANGVFRIDPEGAVTRMLSAADRGRVQNPHHLVLAADGGLYVVGDADSIVWRIDRKGKMTRHYPERGQRGIGIVGLGGDPFTVDRAGNVYCVNERRRSHCQVLRIAPKGRLSVLAGGETGWADGRPAAARFRGLHVGGFAWGPEGSLYLTDAMTRIRRIDRTGHVETLAGGADSGYRDGPANQARFAMAAGLSVAPDGTVYVADALNRRVRRLSPSGDVTTVAGSGKRGRADGPALRATFAYPSGVACAPDGSVYVLDFDDRAEAALIRRLVRGRVATLATFSVKRPPR